MPETRSPGSLARLVAMAKALWDFYWYVVFLGVLWLNEKLKSLKKRKKTEKGKDDKRPK